LPIGNLSFEVYGAGGPITFPNLQKYQLLVGPSLGGDALTDAQAEDWNWMMTIQASEV
jgi:hypothetical protein